MQTYPDTWRLLVGNQRVATDTAGPYIFQANRLTHFGEERLFGPAAHHIAFADTKKKIGTCDMEEIEIVQFGRKEGAFI